jgi:hypothetical protein
MSSWATLWRPRESAVGQSRHFGRRPTTSGLPLETDIVRVGRHASKVPRAEDRRIQMGGLHAPRNALDLSVQRRQYFSRGNEVDDWVLGVECVDDGAQARLTRLRAPLTCEN